MVLKCLASSMKVILKYFFSSLFFLICLTPLQSQTSIEKLTYSIIDSADTQTQQAYSIYNWIASNIKYDVKSYKKGLFPNYLPDEVIKNGKGLCSDYSVLFNEMCKAANIECYTIAGYSKGYQYNKQKPLTRGNHTWNIIYTDSAWKHIDATWGSGYIYKHPPLFAAIMNKLFRTPVALSKIKFTEEYSDMYFDIDLDTLSVSHYPLDPMWLFSPMPITIEKFQNDTVVDSLLSYPNYAEEIEGIRGKSIEHVHTTQAVKSVQYNQYNHFDIAHAYYLNGLNFNIEKDINEQNEWQFNENLNEQTIALNEIEIHRAIIDSIFRSRYDALRQVARDQKRLSGRIKSKAKKAQKTHKSSQKKIVGKSSSYKKKMTNFQMNIGRTEIKKRETLGNFKMVYTDTSEVADLKNNIAQTRARIPLITHKMDSLFNVIDNFAFLDAQIDDSIAQSNTVFNSNLDSLFVMILSSDEGLIIDYVDTLKVVNQDIEDFLRGKKAAKSDLQNTGLAFYRLSTQLQKAYKQELSLNLKLQKITGAPDSLIIAYNQVIDDLIACYKKSIHFTQKLANHNDLQSDVREINLQALKHQKKNINKENKFFVAWYENHISAERTEYSREKELAKTIKNASLKNKKLIESKLKKYEAAQEQKK